MPNNVLILHVLVRLRREKSFVQIAVVLPILPKLDNANADIPAAVEKSRWSGQDCSHTHEPRKAMIATGGTMLTIRPFTAGGPGLFYALWVAVLLMIPGFSLASDPVGTKALQSSGDNVQGQGRELPKEHRIITGTVEEVNANTLRVSAGETGAISPRYLNLDRVKGDVDMRPGDILHIEINALNKVLSYKKVNGKPKN